MTEKGLPVTDNSNVTVTADLGSEPNRVKPQAHAYVCPFDLVLYVPLAFNCP